MEWFLVKNVRIANGASDGILFQNGTYHVDELNKFKAE